MRKTIYATFKAYNNLVIKADKHYSYVTERELDTMENTMDRFIYGKGC